MEINTNMAEHEDSSVVMLTIEVDGVEHAYLQEVFEGFLEYVRKHYKFIKVIDSQVLTGNEFFTKLASAMDVLDEVLDAEDEQQD